MGGVGGVGRERLCFWVGYLVFWGVLFQWGDGRI